MFLTYYCVLFIYKFLISELKGIDHQKMRLNLSGLTSLDVLHLEGVSIDFFTFGQLPALRQLIIFQCKIDDLDFLVYFSSLKICEISRTVNFSKLDFRKFPKITFYSSYCCPTPDPDGHFLTERYQISDQ